MAQFEPVPNYPVEALIDFHAAGRSNSPAVRKAFRMGVLARRAREAVEEEYAGYDGALSLVDGCGK